jgi:hypothetical protein
VDWISNKWSEYRTATANLAAIQQNADTIFGALWASIGEVRMAVEQSTRIGLDTNGTQNDRVVIMVIGKEGKDSRWMNITLSADLRSITAKWKGAPELSFTIEVCSDGVVCLKFGGREISSRDAARKIMEEFLFGEGSPYSSHV